MQDNSNFPSPIFLIGFIFTLLFILASVILAVMLCHYRARYLKKIRQNGKEFRYRREKQNFEDDRIIRNALEDPAKVRRVPPSPPRMPTPEEDDKLGYMSQERKMSVGPDEVRGKA